MAPCGSQTRGQINADNFRLRKAERPHQRPKLCATDKKKEIHNSPQCTPNTQSSLHLQTKHALQSENKYSAHERATPQAYKPSRSDRSSVCEAHSPSEQRRPRTKRKITNALRQLQLRLGKRAQRILCANDATDRQCQKRHAHTSVKRWRSTTLHKKIRKRKQTTICAPQPKFTSVLKRNATNVDTRVCRRCARRTASRGQGSCARRREESARANAKNLFAITMV